MDGAKDGAIDAPADRSNPGPEPDGLAEKEQALLSWFRARSPVLVAFSGGVDSTYVAWIAHRALGDAALAVTARSASLSGRELAAATALAAKIGIRHQIVDTGEIDRPEYARNRSDRCYFCKDTLFDATSVLAEGGALVVDGFNADDLSDHRPGHRAAAERGVAHPLAEHQLTKADVRALSRRAGLPTWNKPQLACLASRLPYGVEVTAERLARVESMEDRLRDLGFFDVRARLVRDNDDLVRIELGEAEIGRAIELRADLVAAGHASGFRFVTLDLEGFRSGRLNEGLVPLERVRAREPAGR